MLIVLICLIWLCNFFLIKQRSTPQINLKKINSGPNWEKSVWQTQPQPQMVILTETGLQEKLDYYKVLADKKINNLGLWLNLQQLYEATEQSDLAKEYFNKAQQIEPQLKL